MERDDDESSRAATGALTEAEHEVYDRQIRVWGVETQKKLSRARALVAMSHDAGNGSTTTRTTRTSVSASAARGLAAETLKNIALAGCGKIVVRDDERDGRSGILASARRGKDGNFLNAAGDDDDVDCGETVAEAMARTLSEMNPFGDISAAESSTSSSVWEESAEYYSKFDVVVACGYTFAQCEAMDAKCREAGCGFFGAFHGAAACYFFTDLGNAHEYVPVGVPSKDGKAVGDGARADGNAPSVARFASLTDVFERCGTDWSKTTRRSPRTPLAATLVRAFEREHGRIPEQADAEAFFALSKTFAERHGAKPDCVPEDALRVVLAPSFESPAINAIVGGVLAQEVLKAVTRKGAPCGNFFVFDAVSGQGVCHNLGDAGDDRR